MNHGISDLWEATIMETGDLVYINSSIDYGICVVTRKNGYWLDVITPDGCRITVHENSVKRVKR